VRASIDERRSLERTDAILAGHLERRIPGVSEVMVACMDCCRAILIATPKYIDELCKEEILIRLINLLATNAQGTTMTMTTTTVAILSGRYSWGPD